MARPLPWTPPARDPRAELQSRLQDAPAEHAEALLAAYEVLQGLHDRGVLEIMRGALGSGERVLEIAVDAARSEQATRSLRNLLLLATMIGDIDPVQLAKVTRAVPATLNAASTLQTPSLLQCFTLLWNRNVRRAVWIGAKLLEAIGRSVASDSKKHEPSN